MRRPGDIARLVGREDELALVDALLARGRESGEALLLYGDPGVGKSAIAAAATAQACAAGATVLTTTGMPSETDVPYTSLQPLLWPVLDDADALPGPQKAALDAAMGLSDEPPKDPFPGGPFNPFPGGKPPVADPGDPGTPPMDPGNNPPTQPPTQPPADPGNPPMDDHHCHDHFCWPNFGIGFGGGWGYGGGIVVKIGVIVYD